MAAMLVSAGGLASFGKAQSPAPVAAGSSPTGAAPAIPAARYVSPAEAPDYVARIAASFTMARRDLDPFGRNQDPNFKPVEPEIVRPDTADQGQEINAPMPLSTLVAAIQVTMVMPNKQTFFVGDRAFHRGDRFPLRTGAGTLVNVEILSVTSSAIIFREISKGETAVLRLGGAPAGMQRGTTLETPPGVTVPNPAAPLDLQPAPVPSTPPR